MRCCMKQAVYYLYEYEENKQMRNVGFVKCQHTGKQVIFQIHGKGLVCARAEKYEMNLFSGADDRCYISRAGYVETEVSKINYRVTVDEVDETIFSDYDGLYIQGGRGVRYVAMWNTKKVVFDQLESYKKVDVAPKEVTVIEEGNFIESQKENNYTEEDSNIISAEGDILQEEFEDACIQSESMNSQELDEIAVEDEEISSQSSVQGSDSPIEAEECCYDTIRRRKEHEEHKHYRDDNNHRDNNHNSSEISYEKIERQDIAKLPQREWRLANNSFLLHGYHNYQHILFIQEGGRSFIGVPGVFSAREADAAKSFGFPVFHRIEPGQLQWDPEECDREADFGYWCKEVSYRMNR